MRLYLLSLACLSVAVSPALATDTLSLIEPAQDEINISAEPDFPEVVNDISRSFVMPLAPAAAKAEQARPAAQDQTTEEVKTAAPKPEKKSEAPQELPPEEAGSYILESGDTVRIGVFGDKDVSGTYNISKEGMISLALIGDVKAAGKTADALKQELTTKLGDGFFVNPQVTIEITEYRPFSIMGDVKNPGRYPYAENMTILNAIATSGGYNGDKDSATPPVRLQRETEKGTFRYHSVPLSTKIKPGDVLVIGAEAP